MNEFCLICMNYVSYEWTMSHMNESCLIWMSHVSYERIMLHMNESRHGGQHTATHCNTLQHTAPHCNTMHHTAIHCNTHDSSGVLETWSWRRICGQRSSMSAGGKRRALVFYLSTFHTNLVYLWESKCTGDSDLGLCTTSRLTKRMPLRSASDNFCGRTRFLIGSRHCAAAFFLKVPKVCTDLDRSLLYIWILKTDTKFVWKNKMLAIGVCFPQTCSSAGRRFAASKSRLHHY